MSAKPKKFRTTISFHPRVHEWAMELVEEGGFDDLSTMLAQLVRERYDGTQGPLMLNEPKETASVGATPPAQSPGYPAPKKKAPSVRKTSHGYVRGRIVDADPPSNT